MMKVHIVPNESGNPPGKLADAELHFHDAAYTSHASDTDPLSGLKLIGFAIWERRGGSGRNVTFPARAYSVNGERRSFALLRPAGTQTTQDASNRIRDLILEAYDEYQRSNQAPPAPTQDEAAAAQSTTTTAPADDPPFQATPVVTRPTVSDRGWEYKDSTRSVTRPQPQQQPFF